MMNCFSSICSVCSVANSDSENNNTSRNNSNNNNNSNGYRISSIFNAFENKLPCISEDNIKKYKLHHPDISRYCCCLCLKNNQRKISPYIESRVSSVSTNESKGTPIIPIVTPPEMYVKNNYFSSPTLFFFSM